MGKVVLSKEDISKLDKLINMFEDQKKKYEEQKEGFKDGIIDFESSTDIILYDAYIVLGKLIKKLPNVEGSDVFQEYVNVVLNELIGDFSNLEDWCTKMLDTTSSLFNSVTENCNDMLDLDLLAEELLLMHNIPFEKVSFIPGNDSSKINDLLSYICAMSAATNNQKLGASVLIVYKVMFRIINLWPQLSNGTSKTMTYQVNDIYNYDKYKERLNKMHPEILNLVPVGGAFDKELLILKSLRSVIDEFKVILRNGIINGEYNDKDKSIASSILLLYDQMCKCLDSYMMANDVFCESTYIREGTYDLDIYKKLPKPYLSTGKLVFDNYLMSFYSMFYPLSLVIDARSEWFDDNRYAGCLDVFSVCSAFNIRRYDGGKLVTNQYVPLANDIAREVQNMSIDEKIDYYLEQMAKYREEMIKENGGSLINVLKARMEQLEGNGVVNEDDQEHNPQGRTGR